ncbi:MAG: alpha/beta fold hydrolase, partial [Chloroflexi bacterium]|nr:alpha/beta fold hydrolase [Chloroflexota bacterium]
MRRLDIRALGLRARVLEEGTGERAVLLVHGVGGWAENWTEVLAPLAERGFRALAIDLPGFGESERPRGGGYFDPARAFYARFVEAALDALGVDRAHLVGNSLGGAVVYTAAVTVPERARSLTLVAGGGVGLEVSRSLRMLTLPGMQLLALVPRTPEAADPVVRSCYFDWSRIPPHMYAEGRRYGNASFGEFIRVLRTGVSFRGVRPRVRDAWASRAGRFPGPVLCVWGREDAVIPVTQAASITDVFPGAELRIIERCGHMPMSERPAEFLGQMLPFLLRAEG